MALSNSRCINNAWISGQCYLVRAMASEKTPALFAEKVPFEYESRKSKPCSKVIASWIFVGLLVALLIVVSIQFLTPSFERKMLHDVERVEIYQEEPFTLKVMPPVMTDYVSEKVPKTRPWELEFLIDPDELCATRNPPLSEEYQRDPEVKLLMMVLSPTSHFQQRKAIRTTWGSIAENPHGAIRMGFIVGTTKNRTEGKLVTEESAIYKDIIQVDLVDTDKKLTIKSILMLKWVARHCPHAQYFLKADDDTFVNVGIIANILGREPFVSEEKFIGGYIQQGIPPSRVKEENYYIPDAEFPSYVSGSAYVTTGPTAVELFEASKDVQPFLPMEDVYITGLCGKHIDATLLHEPRFRLDDPPSPPSWQAYSTLATAYKVTPAVLEVVWDDMTHSLLDHLLNQMSAVNESVVLRKRIIFKK